MQKLDRSANFVFILNTICVSRHIALTGWHRLFSLKYVCLHSNFLKLLIFALLPVNFEQLKYYYAKSYMPDKTAVKILTNSI